MIFKQRLGFKEHLGKTQKNYMVTLNHCRTMGINRNAFFPVGGVYPRMTLPRKWPNLFSLKGCQVDAENGKTEMYTKAMFVADHITADQMMPDLQPNLPRGKLWIKGYLGFFSKSSHLKCECETWTAWAVGLAAPSWNHLVDKSGEHSRNSLHLLLSMSISSAMQDGTSKFGNVGFASQDNTYKTQTRNTIGWLLSWYSLRKWIQVVACCNDFAQVLEGCQPKCFGIVRHICDVWAMSKYQDSTA